MGMRQDSRLRIFEYKVLRKVLGNKKEELGG
jgi:hypothetical protein